MKLTLRSMLGYINGNLSPAEAEALGKKIEESQYATELLEHINDVTRRLRLAAPKLDGRGLGLDINTVAEYLDNTMPTERVHDFERVCLESDVHLAEVAACNQILTLVLRVPVDPDTALRDRMASLPERLAQGQVVTSSAAAAVEHVPHETPAVSKPSKTPPPLDKATVDAGVAAAPVAKSAAVADDTARRKSEVPDYLKTPPKRRKRSPVMALVALLVVAGAIGVFLTQTPPGKAFLASLKSPLPQVAANDKGTSPPPAKGSSATDNVPPVSPAAPIVTDGGTAPTQPVVNPAVSTAPVTTPPGTTPPVVVPGAPVTAPATVLPTQPSPLPTTPAIAPSTPLAQPAMTQPATPAVGVAPAPLPGAPSTVPAAPLPVAPGTSPLPVTTPVVPAPAVPGTVPATTPPGSPTTTPMPVTTSVIPAGAVPTPKTAPAPEPVTPAVVAMGSVVSTDAVLVGRGKQPSAAWKRLLPQAPVSSSEQILSLPAFRSGISLAYGLNIQQWGGSITELVAPDMRNVPGIYLYYGRVMITPAGKPDAELRLGAGSRQGVVAFVTPDTSLAVEVRPIRVDGEDPIANQAPMVIDLFVPQGEVRWSDGSTPEPTTIKGPARLSLGVPPAPGSPAEQQLPQWLVSDDRTEFEKLAAPIVEKEAGADRAITLELKELSDDRRGEVRLLAVRSLVHLGEYEAIVAALRDEGQSRNWDAQIDALREACAISPAIAARVKAAFEQHRGQQRGGALFRMLWGYTPEQFQQSAAGGLVKDLDHEELDYRVLAYWNLRKSAPRVQSNYRPEQKTAQRRPAVVKWEQAYESGQLFQK